MSISSWGRERRSQGEITDGWTQRQSRRCHDFRFAASHIVTCHTSHSTYQQLQACSGKDAYLCAPLSWTAPFSGSWHASPPERWRPSSPSPLRLVRSLHRDSIHQRHQPSRRRRPTRYRKLDSVFLGAKYFLMKIAGMGCMARLRSSAFSGVLPQDKPRSDRAGNSAPRLTQVLVRDGYDTRNLMPAVLAQGALVGAMLEEVL